MELGEVLRRKGTLLLMLGFLCGELSGHFFNLLPQGLNFCVFLPKQAFLLLDFPGVNHNFFYRDQLLVKFALHIVGAIAVIHPLDEFKESPQGDEGISGCNVFFGVYSQIAKLNQKGQLSPSLIVHCKTKRGLMDQGL